MPKITLPDGNQISFDQPVSTLEIAKSISPSLAKSTIAGKINGQLIDASLPIKNNSSLLIITEKDPEGIEIIRHSFAHLIGHAVKQIFPSSKMAIGPVINNGFYYDIALNKNLSIQDLDLIEERMNKLIKQNYDIIVEIINKDEAYKIFKNRNEIYKMQIINEIKSGEEIKIYKHQEYIDLCRGPHVPNTKHLKHFKLTKLAGAYWKGDNKNEMLQRIYGTAWHSKQQLNDHLQKIQEAEKRDHRKIGKKLSLFHIQEESPGMIFWHPNGWTIYQVLQDFIRDKLIKSNYQEVKTPQVVDRSLWEKSGHWNKFRDDMFTTSSENREYAIKPMNCPCHIQIFNKGLKSYKDLPLRLSEFGSCHRNEPSGALHGLMRVRNFVQDDAHIFCMESQIQSEVSLFIDTVFEIYKAFGFENIIIKLSTRPQERVGSDEVWDKSEGALKEALNKKSLDWELLPGEGAFYGPKIEFSLKDSLDRIWQCGTIQVDFSMPERLNATYIDHKNNKKTPVMLHRAILGSFERFIGILIEEYEGKFPSWLAPTQIIIMSITERNVQSCKSIFNKLNEIGFRVELDLRNEKIGLKIREHTLQKIPFLIIIGDKEELNQKLTIRLLNGIDLGQKTYQEAISIFQESITKKEKLN
tara:strand:+ start:34272 stop:36188 length:1917 start_codon:yes stop_codon:yes gene_type:complete